MTDLELLCRVAYEEYFRLHPHDLQRAHWVMSADMLVYVRQLRDSYEQPLLLDLPHPPCNEPLVLLGRPVEIRDGVEGIHLVAA